MPADTSTAASVLADPDDALRPDPGTEADFVVENNPFAFSPGQLNKLLNPKNMSAFRALGGLAGIVRGLHTDLTAGLSVDEEHMEGRIRFDEAGVGDGRSEFPAKTSNNPASATSDEPFVARKRVFSDNKPPERRGKSFAQILWSCYHGDKILVLLTCAALVSLALGLYDTYYLHLGSGIDLIEGVAIVVAVFVVVLFGSINDYQKERQFAKFSRKKEDRAVKVIRSGKPVEVSVYDILVGDVVYLEPGDLIPADGIFIQGFNVKCDESSATGEADIVVKQPGHHASGEKDDPFIISGSRVMEGLGTYVVTSTGVNSCFGKIMASVEEDARGRKLEVSWTRKIVGSVTGLPLILEPIFAHRLLSIHEQSWDCGLTVIGSLAYSSIFKVASVVEAQLRARRLAKRSNNMDASTKPLPRQARRAVPPTEMHVVAATWLQDGHASNTGNDAEMKTTGTGGRGTLLSECIAINSTAFESTYPEPMFIGSKTEVALLQFARDHLQMGDIAEVRSKTLQMIPFDSSAKWMGVIGRLDNGKARLYVKGSPEVVIAKCSEFMVDPTSSEVTAELDDKSRKTLGSTIDGYVADNLRTIAMAYRDLDDWHPNDVFEYDDLKNSLKDIMHDMILVGAVGIRDPLRGACHVSTLHAQPSEIRVRMVSGDNLATANAIARECGILTTPAPEDSVVMEGPQFRRMTSDEQRDAVRQLRVLARSSLEDKRILVQHLRSMGDVVAVTGDGTIDATAELGGFSMGIAGTDIAKEASQIVLMDDNFSSIVKALSWGRAVNESVKKYLKFQLAVNAAAILPHILNMTSGDLHPVVVAVLSVAQILLWVNLIMVTLATLALAFGIDPTNRHTPERANPPVRSSRSSLSMLRRFNVPKLILACTVFSHCATIVAAASLLDRFSSPLRIGSGVTAAGSAVAIIPLRTVKGVTSIGWIIPYVMWAVCFILYLGMQLVLIPSEKKYRRRMFLFCVILATVHFSIGVSAQSETTVTDGFTIFGPLISTVSVYLMGLLFAERDDAGNGADPEANPTFAAWMGLCG